MNRIKASIGLKLMSILAVGLIASTVLIAVLSFSKQSAHLTAEFAKNAKTFTNLYAGQAGGPIKFKKTDALEALKNEVKQRFDGDVSWVAFVNIAGDILLLDAGDVGADVATDLLAQNIEIAQAAGAEAGTPMGASSIGNTYLEPVTFGPKATVIGGIVVGWSDAKLKQTMSASILEGLIIELGISVVALLVTFVLVGRLVIRPINAIDNAMTRLAKGETDVTVPATDRTDEIGRMAMAAQAFRKSISKNEEQRLRQVEAEKQAEDDRVRMLASLEESIGTSVRHAENGRFETRIGAQFDDPVLNGIANGVDGVFENVQSFLSDLDQSVSSLASGDLTNQISGSHSGSFGEVSEKFNTSLSELRALISAIRTTGNELSSTVGEVAESAVDLSRQAESQAGSLEETSASMEDMTKLVRLTTRRASEIAEQTKETQGRAEKGQAVVTGAVAAMQEIESSSARITEIISVIDGIAFQTNLLSLNAAVEAARAGEAGKGFAVVAAEVRTLAQSSSNAANDIKELILASQSKVQDGSGLVRAMGEELETIIESIKGVSDQIGEVSEATQEQSVGVTEISSVISNLDTTTQNYAGHAERSASSARMLAEKTEMLIEHVDRFQSGSDEPPVEGADSGYETNVTAEISVGSDPSSSQFEGEWTEFGGADDGEWAAFGDEDDVAAA